MKKNDIAVIIVFLIFIFLPNVLYFFVKDHMDNNNYENRELYTKPELSFKTLNDFPKAYENYFNDHLAFKNDISKIRANILYSLFDTSFSDRVIVGKDGWLFYNSEAANDGNTIENYYGNELFDNEKKELYATSLSETNSKLKDKNIEFYALAIPNKETIYSDKLKGILPKNPNNLNKLDDLVKYLNDNTDLNIVYPKEALYKNRNKQDTYFKFDTHWNNYGAYIGTIELVKAIEKEYVEPKIKIEKENASGDLAKMNLTKDVLKNQEPKIIEFYDDVKYTCLDEGATLQNCKSDKATFDKTILFVGDSFRELMVQYLSKVYKNVIFVHRNNYNEDFIEKYKPDIVVYEVVERYTSSLLGSNLIFVENQEK